MIRRLLAMCLAGAMMCYLGARADDPPAKAKDKSPTADRDEELLTQERLKEQFGQFKNALLQLAQRLERSSRPEDRERAVNLKDALKKAGDVNADQKFTVLINLLRADKTISLTEVKEAMIQSNILADDIHEILKILLSDNRDAQLKAEKERLMKLLQALDKIIREQKVVRAVTEAGQMEKSGLKKSQEKVTESTKDLAKAMSKPGESKSGESKGGKSNSQGQPKEGKEGKQGKPKQDSNLPPPQDTSGRKHIEDAVENQHQAEKKLEEEKRQEASNQQDEAIKKLEEARKKLEELLKQLREEERQRILAALEARCRRMLGIQIEVYENTVRLEKQIAQNPDKKAGRSDEQRSLKLADREQELVREANTCIQILENEGSSAAFPEMFIQVRDDMMHVTRRLGKADVGTVTQTIEQDIIANLKDMIEALKKAQSQGGGGGANGPRPNQKLIDRLAELKMIRAMQIRVNTRTLTYARQYPGEQANDPDIRAELSNLAQRQLKVFEVTNNIARGKTSD